MDAAVWHLLEASGKTFPGKHSIITSVAALSWSMRAADNLMCKGAAQNSPNDGGKKSILYLQMSHPLFQH